MCTNCRTHNVQGTISVNGKPRELTQFRKMSCYIMQDDVLLPHLTVYESMKYAAQLKLPRKTPKSQRELVVCATQKLFMKLYFLTEAS